MTDYKELADTVREQNRHRPIAEAAARDVFWAGRIMEAVDEALARPLGSADRFTYYEWHHLAGLAGEALTHARKVQEFVQKMQGCAPVKEG